MAFADSLFQFCLDSMRDNPVLLLFILLGSGYLIGNLRIAGFSLGSVAGVLFAGLFFGQFGLTISPGAQALGFALFIFSVGYQAGPRFFSAIREDGLRYFTLSLIVTLSAVGIAVLVARLLEVSPGVSAGLLAGGLTSSPTLAAAQEAVREGTVALATDLSPDAVMNNIASAYAITYIFGLTGLITLIRYMPRMLGLDLAEEARRQEELSAQHIEPPNMTTRCYRVNNPAFTSVPLHRLKDDYCARIPVLKVVREERPLDLGPDDFLQIGDIVELIGPRQFFTAGIQEIGPEISPDWDLGINRDSGEVVVTNKDVTGRSLIDLRIPQSFGVLVTHITRMGVQMPYSANLVLRKGDVVAVMGPASRIDLFGEYAGVMERKITETDMVTFSFGISAGVLLGMLSVHVGGVAIGLGTAGGLLASGLLIGYLRSVRPTFGRLPEAARWLLMEFGLLLFMAGVGLRAGGSIFETLAESGPLLIAGGVAVTTIPL